MEPTYTYAIGPSLETIVHETGLSPNGARFVVVRIQPSQGAVTWHAAEVRPSGKLSLWPKCSSKGKAMEHAASVLADVTACERKTRR